MLVLIHSLCIEPAYDPISKQKAPKVIADAVSWINSALIDFGTPGVSLRTLIDCLKAALQNSNAAVRTSATKTLVTVKLFAGSGTSTEVSAYPHFLIRK